MDQIKYQVASGVIKGGDRMPSVRELAAALAVNQNTILKVYNELCRENVLVVERGEGTFVSSECQHISPARKLKAMEGIIREAAVQALQLGISIEQVQELLEKEHAAIKSSKKKAEAAK
ncbi:MAG TPA: GntR family transcriptional regulator [Sedimentisphaerales bacterium]|nr:GntR family transcriptional regulator [Sedimentisphaerales bacterium]